MTQSEGIIEFVNFKEKAFCNIPKINIGDNLNNLESNFFELLKNKTWKEKVVSGESVHKIVKVTNQTNNSCYLHTSISAILDEEKNFKGYLYIARDISQEQTLELQLKRLSNQLQEAYHIAHIGNFELDAKTLSAFWSDEVCDIVGIKRETVGGPELLKTLVREKDFEQIESSLISALQTGSEHEMIYEVFPKNGTKSRWVECRARRELNEDGTPRCLIGTIQDITQRVEAQKQARENEDSMILALESAGHGVWDYNAKENIQYLSPQYKSMLGYDNDEMDNTLEAFVNLLHPDDLSQVQSTIESFFINKHYKGDKFHHTFRMKTKDGSYRWILSNGNVISTDKDGTIVRVIGTHTDISEQQKLQEELLQINKKLTKLSDTIPAMIYQYQLYPDGSSRFPYASVGIEDIYEVTPKQVMDDAQSVFDVVYPDDLAMVVDSITKSAETMQLWNLDYRVTLPKKGLRWLRGTAKPQKLEDGAILWHGYIQDITKEKNNFNILRENERKLRQSATVFENTTEGVMITDTNSIILDVNEAFCQITGRERNETLGKPASILKSGKHNKKFYQDMWKDVSQLGSWRGEIWNRRKNGEIYPQLLNISSVKNSSNVVESYIAVFSDISSLKETQAQLDFLAHHDHLTELPNRILLNERLKHTLSTAKRDESMTAVIFMDIDNFKNINDSYGHTFGDELLIAVSHRLKIIMREDDTFSRIGGDEFVIVMSHFRTLEQITRIAQKIMEQFEKVFTIEEKEFWISVSIGISVAPDDGNSSEVLIINADTAMYEAKGDGKNTFKFYNDKMSASSFERVVFESALKAGIQNKEFEVYYQPQEDLEDNSIIGFEALVRWHHPTLGLVPPDKFISIAEETKMILDIGEFVLEQSCKDIKQWHDEGLCKGRIAVNVSGVQLEHSEFAEILKYNLKKYDVDPSMIEIEVTESMVMKNPDRWISILEEIHRIGVSISIDDFGTGYSSLSYLRRLPVDTLKIDQSFVQDIPEEKDACAIVDAIINMADSLGLNTLAEGIETIAQREYLVKKSCTHAQGYLLSKPMNTKDTYSWLQTKQG